MAKRYSVASPSTGTGGAKVLFAGGGGARGGGIPKAAPGGLSIDLGFDKMIQSGEDNKKRKYLIEGGLDPRAVALMDTQSLDLGVRAMADDLMEAKKEEAAAAKVREGGTFLQDLGALGSEPPRNWIGSEYERVRGNLDSPARQELPLEEPVTKPAPIVPPQDDPAANLFPWLKETGDKRISPQQEGSLPYGTPETQEQIDAIGAAERAKMESDPFWDIGAETFREDTDLGPVPERNLTRAEEGLAAFLGLSPEVATGVFAEHKAFQEGLVPEEPEKYASRDYETTDKEGNSFLESRWTEGPKTGERKYKIPLGRKKHVEGQRTFTHQSIADEDIKDSDGKIIAKKGEGITRVYGLDGYTGDVNWGQVFNTNKPKKGSPKIPNQVLSLFSYLRKLELEKIAKDTNREQDQLTPSELKNIAATAWNTAQNPMKWANENINEIEGYKDHLKKLGKWEFLNKLMEGGLLGGGKGGGLFTEGDFKGEE